jgi:hypothetical protein
VALGLAAEFWYDFGCRGRGIAREIAGFAVSGAGAATLPLWDRTGGVAAAEASELEIANAVVRLLDFGRGSDPAACADVRACLRRPDGIPRVLQSPTLPQESAAEGTAAAQQQLDVPGPKPRPKRHRGAFLGPEVEIGMRDGARHRHRHAPKTPDDVPPAAVDLAVRGDIFWRAVSGSVAPAGCKGGGGVERG